jgi:hypothetical protein
MINASDPATCPDGHDDTVKLLSTVAVTGTSRGAAPAPKPAGGCCGGGCCS